MKCILLLVIVAVSVSGQKPCCFPDQWEGLLGGSIAYATQQGESGVETMFGTVSADYKNNKLLATETFVNMKLRLNVLQDFNKDIMYFIYPDNNTCTQQPLKGLEFGQCIPDTADYLGRFTYGLGEFAYDIFNAAGERPEMIGVSVNKCIPMFTSSQYSIPDQVSIYENLGYNNITLGIKDPSVFDLPSYCNSISKPIFNLNFGSQLSMFQKLKKK